MEGSSTDRRVRRREHCSGNRSRPRSRSRSRTYPDHRARGRLEQDPGTQEVLSRLARMERLVMLTCGSLEWAQVMGKKGKKGKHGMGIGDEWEDGRESAGKVYRHRGLRRESPSGDVYRFRKDNWRRKSRKSRRSSRSETSSSERAPKRTTCRQVERHSESREHSRRNQRKRGRSGMKTATEQDNRAQWRSCSPLRAYTKVKKRTSVRREDEGKGGQKRVSSVDTKTSSSTTPPERASGRMEKEPFWGEIYWGGGRDKREVQKHRREDAEERRQSSRENRNWTPPSPPQHTKSSGTTRMTTMETEVARKASEQKGRKNPWTLEASSTAGYEHAQKGGLIDAKGGKDWGEKQKAGGMGTVSQKQKRGEWGDGIGAQGEMQNQWGHKVWRRTPTR